MMKKKMKAKKVDWFGKQHKAQKFYTAKKPKKIIKGAVGVIVGIAGVRAAVDALKETKK